MNTSKIENRNLEIFSQFGKSGARKGRKNRVMITNSNSNLIVAYTRVSGKEQEKNMSLPWQKQVIEDAANRNNKTIEAWFGGSYESAQTDGRKEFQRMLDYIRKAKGRISEIWVYATDRFSRTGGSAIEIAEKLRSEYGVKIYAVTQPTDTSDPSGAFNQNIQFLFSKYDNDLRRQRAVAGLTYKYERGIWLSRPPQGYDIVKINSERSIVINEHGKKIKKAFEWKLSGMRNDEIVKRLKELGVKMYKQQLQKIFSNPFYCGLIVHGLLKGQVREGTHERMISKADFLKIHQVVTTAPGFGVSKEKENDHLPLKLFMKCGDCGKPMTGYIVKAKNLYYYKCRTTGCKLNRNADQLHMEFEMFLNQFCLKPELIAPLIFVIEEMYYERHKDAEVRETALRTKLSEVHKKLETIEEKFFVLEEMDRAVFEKFYQKYSQEKSEIEQELANCTGNISNLKKSLEIGLTVLSKVNTIWASGELRQKEQFLKIGFPAGIQYDRKNRSFRTEKINSVFTQVAHLARLLEESKKGPNDKNTIQSLLAEREGFEPPEV